MISEDTELFLKYFSITDDYESESLEFFCRKRFKYSGKYRKEPYSIAIQNKFRRRFRVNKPSREFVMSTLKDGKLPDFSGIKIVKNDLAKDVPDEEKNFKILTNLVTLSLADLCFLKGDRGQVVIRHDARVYFNKETNEITVTPHPQDVMKVMKENGAEHFLEGVFYRNEDLSMYALTKHIDYQKKNKLNKSFPTKKRIVKSLNAKALDNLQLFIIRNSPKPERIMKEYFSGEKAFAVDLEKLENPTHYKYAALASTRSFHASTYYMCLAAQEAKLFQPPKYPNESTNERVLLGLSFLQTQLRINPKNKADLPDSLTKFFYLCMKHKFTLTASSGIVAQKVLHNVDQFTKEFFDDRIPVKSELLGQAVEKLFRVFNGNCTKEELTEEFRHLLKCAHKDEGKGYMDERNKVRSINVESYFTLLILYPFMKPFSSHVKQNLPFFQGFAKTKNGCAVMIDQMLSSITHAFKQQSRKNGVIVVFKITSFESDIKAMDHTQNPIRLKQVIYWQIECFYCFTDYDQPIKKSDSEETIFKKKMCKIIKFQIDNSVLPLVYNQQTGRVVQTSHYMPSGTLVTSTGNNCTLAVAILAAFQKALCNYEKRKKEGFFSKNEVIIADRFFLNIMSTPVYVLMGDNNWELVPFFLDVCFFIFDNVVTEQNYRTEVADPYSRSVFAIAFSEFGMTYKPSETKIVFDWVPHRAKDPTDEPVLFDGYGRGEQACFCSNYFTIIELPDVQRPEGLLDHVPWFSGNRHLHLVPARKLTTYVSKTSPENSSFHSLGMLLIKINSLVLDCGLGNPMALRFLMDFAIHLKSILLVEDKMVIDKLQTIFHKHPDFFVKYKGSYFGGSSLQSDMMKDLERLDIIPSIGLLKNNLRLHDLTAHQKKTQELVLDITQFDTSLRTDDEILNECYDLWFEDHQEFVSALIKITKVDKFQFALKTRREQERQREKEEEEFG